MAMFLLFPHLVLLRVQATGKGKVPNAYAVRRTVRSLRSQRYAVALRSMTTKLPGSGEQRQ